MNILLAYETYSGGTMSAAEFAANYLKEKGHTVTLLHIHESIPTEYPNYDVVIMATPSWLERGEEGQPHINVLRFMDQLNGSSLQGKFAFFGLGDSTYAHYGKGVETLQSFIETKGGTIISPLLKIDSFLFEQKKGKEELTKWLQSLPLS